MKWIIDANFISNSFAEEMMERETRFELATSTLARLRSTS